MRILKEKNTEVSHHSSKRFKPGIDKPESVLDPGPEIPVLQSFYDHLALIIENHKFNKLVAMPNKCKMMTSHLIRIRVMYNKGFQ